MSELRLPDLNYIILAGRVATEPDMRVIPSGRYVTRFRLANNRRYKLANGDYKTEPLFVDVVVWDRQAEFVKQYCKKGRPLIVEGRLRFDEWESRVDGLKRSRLEIVAQRVTPLDILPTEQVPEEETLPPDEEIEGNDQVEPNDSTIDYKLDTPITEDDVPF